jgi:hypothetical protein
MNGTSGFQEVRSSISRSPAHRLLRKQQAKSGKFSWRFLSTKELLQMALQVRVPISFPFSCTIDSHGNVEEDQTNVRPLGEQWTTRH